uniref:Uncharacterized protein n=1 Tax=Anguilla anguilla TaxID=7936 RepID=A0A0E9RDJ7_ANGAN
MTLWATSFLALLPNILSHCQLSECGSLCVHTHNVPKS